MRLFKPCPQLGKLLIIPFKGVYVIDTIVNDTIYYAKRGYRHEGLHFEETACVEKKDFKRLGITIDMSRRL